MALSLAVANTPFVTGFQTDWLYWHQSWFSSVFHNKFNPSYFNLQGGSKLGTQYIVYKLLLYTYFWPTLYIQQDATLHSLFYLEAVLHFSGRTITHHQERKQLYLQHTQTSSNSSTIAADSSNGVTNTRCCRYSCICSWWWVEVPPETCRAVSR